MYRLGVVTITLAIGCWLGEFVISILGIGATSYDSGGELTRVTIRWVAVILLFLATWRGLVVMEVKKEGQSRAPTDGKRFWKR